MIAALCLEPIYSRAHRAVDPATRSSAGPKTWVADVTSEGRSFLPLYHDYTNANGAETRGVREYAFLYPGRVYEAYVPKGGYRFDRFFCIARDGRAERISKEEGLSLAAGIDAPLPLAKSRTSKRKERTYLDIDVLTAARDRIAWTFDRFPRIYLSFSGGKDSSVMLHLVMDEAKKRGRKVGLLFIDLEAQYKLTIDHIQEMFDRYADNIEPYWIALPLSLRNAVSQYEPKWTCWGDNADWVRQPPKMAITERDFFPFFRYGMEFEEFTPAFGEWYSQGQPTVCFVGIRTAESLNRYRTIMREKAAFEGRGYTTWTAQGPVFNVYPIYDWRTEDIWTYHAKHPDRPYNRLYDRMHQAGLTIHQMRICQPYGDDQRKGLWLFQVIEPETWARIVARVNGANAGAMYAKESGNILGNLKITKPEGHTWESFAMMLLASMPEKTAEHYKDKIAVFLKWWMDRGYPDGIPDWLPPREENAPSGHRKPSWRRICKVLLKNDYWCKGLSFSPTKSDSQKLYKALMRRRRQQWGIFAN